MTPDLTDLAWLAGIMEGEGSIRINAPTRKNSGALIVAVTSTDLDMLTNVAEIAGVGRIKHGGDPVGNRREYWRWTCASRQAARLLGAIAPYCRVARCRGKIALALEYQKQKTRDTRVNRSPLYAGRQVTYFGRMKALNVRGAAR